MLEVTLPNLAAVGGSDGRRASAVLPTTTVVWGDSATGLPFLVEITNSKYLMPGAKVTLSDFEFNIAFEESLFTTQPPVDYQVQNLNMSLEEPTEKDLISAFELYSNLSKGRFPDVLDTRGLQGLAVAMGYDKKLPQGKAMEEWMNHCTKLNRGFAFALSLPPETSVTYAGKGIRHDMKTPIFWYKPVGATKYRVISADLSVHAADVAPDVKAVQR